MFSSISILLFLSVSFLSFLNLFLLIGTKYFMNISYLSLAIRGMFAVDSKFTVILLKVVFSLIINIILLFAA